MANMQPIIQLLSLRKKFLVALSVSHLRFTYSSTVNTYVCHAVSNFRSQFNALQMTYARNLILVFMIYRGL